MCNKFGDEIYAEKKIILSKIDNPPSHGGAPKFL